MQHISLYEHFKFLFESTPKFCKFKTRSFDNMANQYISYGLVHDEQQFKRDVEMGLFSTPNTTEDI